MEKSPPPRKPLPSEITTEPIRMSGFPFRTIKVEVVGGPDTGKSLQAETDTITVGSAPGNDLQLGDPTVSRFHLELTRTPDGVLVVDCRSTNGVLSGGVRIERAFVAPGATLSLGKSQLQVLDGASKTEPMHEKTALGRLRGGTPAMRRLMTKIEQTAKNNAAVLLVGESGTGKELIASAIHELSPRGKGPWVSVNCGTLSLPTIATELFGQEGSAEVGPAHAGAFERASGGTLFLDEIGALPPTLQAALLGAVERKVVRRAGGSQDIPVDVRLVCATSRDLRGEVNENTFRVDLYYRIAVVVLRVPALRERKQDIPLLVEQFLRECGFAGPVEEVISSKVMQDLYTHAWPGNVRELRNVVEAAVVTGEPLAIEKRLGAQLPVPSGDLIGDLMHLSYKDARNALLQQFEARYLRQLLTQTDGNVSRAARDAQMDRSHLIDLLHRHNIK